MAKREKGESTEMSGSMTRAGSQPCSPNRVKEVTVEGQRPLNVIFQLRGVDLYKEFNSFMVFSLYLYLGKSVFFPLLYTKFNLVLTEGSKFGTPKE